MTEGYSLDGYIEVPDRIVAFKDKHPEGSLQGAWELREIAGDTWIVYVAKAYRTPDDPTPGVGTAWEPYPGKTPYTKDSELQNAETSAWGRAIVALGFLAKGDKIASAQEVRNRQGSNGAEARSAPTDKQLDFLEKLVKKLGSDPAEIPNIRAYCEANLTGGKTGSASKLIDKLTGDDAGQVALDLAAATDEWKAQQQAKPDVPADAEGLDQPAEQATLA